MTTTRESQYEILFDVEKRHGRTKLGLMVNESWNQDPKRTLFTLSRYKFVSKMLAGCDTALEIGCADAFGTRIVQQAVKSLTAIDFDPVFVEDVLQRADRNWPMRCFVHDILESPVSGVFDAAFSLDVLEHIPVHQEEEFITNIINSLSQDGVVIVGTPSIESQLYASSQSRAGHINCKSGEDLRRLFSRFFRNVFLFSMNDEVLHTGFSPMAHYLFVVCCGPRELA